MSKPYIPLCYVDNSYGFCIGKTSNNYFYHRCIECNLFEVALCENCDNLIFVGFSHGYHMRCGLSKSSSWLPHTRALLKRERYDVCPNYKRRKAWGVNEE